MTGRDAASAPPPDIPAAERAHLVRAALLALPPGTVATDPIALGSVVGGDPRSAGADPRIVEWMTSPLVAALLDWLGLHAELARSGDEGDARFSAAGIPLGQLVSIARKHFDAMLREEMAWILEQGPPAAGRAASPAVDPRAMALAYSLFTAGAHSDLGMSDFEGAHLYFDLLTSVWRRVDVGRYRLLDAKDLDEYQLINEFVGLFWISTVFTSWQAMASGLPPPFDPARDFPDVAFTAPPQLTMAFLPPLLERKRKLPVPDILRTVPHITTRMYYSWLDPLADPLPEAERAAVLKQCVAGIKDFGLVHFGSLLPYFGLKVGQFHRWLRDEAGMSMLDLVLVASRQDPADETGIFAPGSPFSSRVLSNPHLPEALRRHSFFRDVMHRIFAALPPDALADSASGNVAALQASFRLPPLLVQLLLSYLTQLRLMSASLCAPEPFADHDLLSDDESSPSAELLTAWFATPAFITAFADASAISSAVRGYLAAFTPEEIRGNLFNAIICHSAVQAAWIQVLVLRRFAMLMGGSPERELTDAAALHGAITRDAQTCLDLLGVMGKDPFAEARMLLEDLLGGRETGLSPGERAVLRAARQTFSTCAHGAGMPGRCWLCAAWRADRDNDGRDAQGSESSLEPGELRTELAWLSLSDATAVSSAEDVGKTASPAPAGRNKRVRFSKDVAVHETYSADEYRRGRLALDDVEDAGGVGAPIGAAGHVSLGMLNAIRDPSQYPDLRRFW